jgi:hypothetical protein
MVNSDACPRPTTGWLSDESVNDDDTHGLGNEFGAGTNAGGIAQNIASSEWWHDASVDQADCHGTSCVVQGTDHGTSLNDGPMLGQYAVYTGTFDGFAPTQVTFPCGAMAATVEVSAGGPSGGCPAFVDGMAFQVNSFDANSWADGTASHGRHRHSALPLTVIDRHSLGLHSSRTVLLGVLYPRYYSPLHGGCLDAPADDAAARLARRGRRRHCRGRGTLTNPMAVTFSRNDRLAHG